MLTYDEVVEFIHNPLAYEQNLVSIINTKGEQILLSSSSELYSSESFSIKVEGMEKFSLKMWNTIQQLRLRYNHNGPATCHVFIAQQDSPSFGMHTDPDDVLIHCIEGHKTMIIDNQKVDLYKDDSVFIKANTPHQALNENFAVTLSFGFEKYLKDKALNYELVTISKDNRDMQS
jgi:mannose-6-phosphate isomerase-like protein (cupin superfamily)